jgi:CHAT domain-containing protein/Tfp pilus assembly protein PilF
MGARRMERYEVEVFRSAVRLAIAICLQLGLFLHGQVDAQSVVDKSIASDFAEVQRNYGNQKAEYHKLLIEQGAKSPDLLVHVENLLLLSVSVKEFEDWRGHLARRAFHCEAIYGVSSSEVWDAKLAVSLAKDNALLTESKKEQLAAAAQLYLRVDSLLQAGRDNEALEAIMKAAKFRGEALGTSHPDVTNTLLDALLLTDSPVLASERDAIEEKLESMIRDDQPDYFFTLNEYASWLYRRSHYSDAEKVFKRIIVKLQDEGLQKSRLAAKVFVDLGTLLYLTGDFIGAREKLGNAMEILGNSAETNSTDLATCLHYLSLVMLELREPDVAKKHYEQSLILDEQLLGRVSIDYWRAKLSYAWLLYKIKDFELAYKTADQAVNELKHLGDTSVLSMAGGLTVLGKAAQGRGWLNEAESYFRDALNLFHENESDADMRRYEGVLLNNLAKCLQVRGEFEKALTIYPQALSATERELDRLAILQSERQQISVVSSLKYQLDNYLSCILEMKPSADITVLSNAYQEVLRWKGSVLVRQKKIRDLPRTGKLSDLFSQLQAAATRLSKLSNSRPVAETAMAEWHSRLQIATEEQEEIQRQLTNEGAKFLEEQRSLISAEAFLRSLPDDVTIVDYLQISTNEPRLVAFVVGKARPVFIIDVGSVDKINQAIEAWRIDIQTRQRTSQAAQDLRDMVWEPVARRIDTKHTVLISTDGELSRIPFAALPGRERKRYLIEERRIALLPVPQLLPEILSEPKTASGLEKLLTLGDANYEAVTPNEKAAPPSHKRDVREVAVGTRSFGPLVEAGREAERVEELFQNAFKASNSRVQRLRKELATEARFRSLAPECNYIHLATHGFFAASALSRPKLSSTDDAEFPASSRAWRGVPEGLASGLAFAGANRPSRTNDFDDGILTAEEIATLPLNRVRMAVLSACETGLGKSAGGEGVLGLQRAFQVAGVKTTIASLWNVSDMGTRLLMDRFYENLWKGKLGTVDAFREAQLYMLGRSDRDRGTVGLRAAIVELPNAVVRPLTPKESALSTDDFNHPFYWASFTLAGDWR